MASRNHFKYWENILIRDFMSSFRSMTPNWLQNGCAKSSELLKYDHIIYYFKARDLEIPLV